jgi:hypothetical protein
MTPRYQTLEEIPVPAGVSLPPEMLYGTGLILRGAIIDYAGPPGPHLYPLNDEARARMEDWYQEWFEHRQDNPDGTTTMVRLQPHMKFRQIYSAPGEQHTLTVVAPAQTKPQGPSLAESQIPGSTQRVFDQRPGPANGTQIRKEYETPAMVGSKPEQLELGLVAAPPPLPSGDPAGSIRTTKAR